MQDQFKQTYFEECEDRIQEAEEGLSLMLDGNLDSDIVNQVFRGIHSIKGGAGAFAFEKIVDFAHEFETVLDFVRDGKLEPDRDMCTLFLRANDVVAGMINTERDGATIADNVGADILVELKKIVETVEGADAAASPVNANVTENDNLDATWSISFAPHASMLKTGNEPVYIFQALRDLGELTVNALTDDLPNFESLNPQECHVSWRLTLKSAATEEEIREVFDFVEDLSDLSIERQNVPPGNLPERRKAYPDVPSANTPQRRQEDKDNQETASTGSTSIRVDLGRIDQLVNLVGEMVIAQSMLQEQVRWLPSEVGGKLGEGVEHLTRHMRDLQESVMSVRAQPIKSVFTRMPRIIREVSAAVGKDVRLTTFGEETEVDKTVLENLIDPLTHMIRNSVDHGIEDTAAREAKGKSPYGNIQLSARHKSGRIIIEVEDDGGGVNREAVLAKAEKQGLIDDNAQLTPNEIDNLIFKAGFSTAETVSEVSGRGVGMDVVRRNVMNLGGRISVHSIPGEGCRMTLSLPLTLAVMDGMVVSVGSQRFVLPTVNIIESFQPSMDTIGSLTGGVNVIKARGEYVRVIPLYNLFGINDAITRAEEALIILLESDDGEKLAVMVDDVLGQQQVVIKSLETNYQAVNGISAATILGNGDVALILDVPGLTDMKADVDLKRESNAHLQSLKDIEQDSIDTSLSHDESTDADIDALQETITSDVKIDEPEFEGSMEDE